MALNVTLLDLRTQVRDRADVKHSTFVTDTEINSYINSAYAELYDMLVKSTEDYYIVSAPIVFNGAVDKVALPSDFYKLNGVDYSINGIVQPMEKFVFQDRNKYVYNTNVVRYRIVKDSIVLKPLPAAQTITIWYTPSITPLTSDGDTVDGVNGWEDWIVLSAAIVCLIKEESDVSMLLAEQAGLSKRIKEMSINRDQGKPERVTDVTGSRIPAFYLGDDSWV
jgi:hypothetical protein